MQFMSAVILPQFLLSGLLTLTRLVGADGVGSMVWWDLTVLAGCVAIAFAVGSVTLRRTTG